MIRAATITVGLIAGVVYFLPGGEDEPIMIAEPANAHEFTKTGTPASASTCEQGIPAGDVVAVNDEYQVRDTPNADGQRIVNRKASEALGRTHYHQIDNSITVRRLCVLEEWTQIRVVTPEWLTHVSGWAPSRSLRTIETTTAGVRVYEAQDFHWDSSTSPYRDQLVSAVNQIAQSDSRCTRIDTASLSLSPTRSKPGEPVFFVTCDMPPDAFNVWFQLG